MPLSIQCPNCGKKLTAKDEMAGKKATCPACKKVLLIPSARPAARPTPPPAPLVSEKDFTDNVIKPVGRRRKRKLLPLYVGGGAVVVCLAIIAIVLANMSSGDRKVAKSTEPAPKASAAPRTAATPAPKPQPKPEPKPAIAKTETTSKPDAKDDPEPEPRPEAKNKPSAKLAQKEKQPDAAGTKAADVAQGPAVDRQSVEQVQELLKQLGFTIVAELGESPDMHVPGPDGRDYAFNVWTCENKGAGTALSLTRNMTLAGASNVPGERYEIRASLDEKNRDALAELCRRISPALEKALRECAAQYDRTKMPSQKPVEKIKVYADRTGVYIESIPAVIPGVHFTAVAREAGGIAD
jgi:outer membrane biosynthesis protein TonB